MSEKAPTFSTTPSEANRVDDIELAHAMAEASNGARSDAADSRARYEANPGTALAETEKRFGPMMDSLGNRQETAVQNNEVPEDYSSEKYQQLRAHARQLGSKAFDLARRAEASRSVDRNIAA